MKIFRFQHTYTYTEVILMGIKISHHHKILNKYISLGTNCFPRMKLNQHKIKPSKNQGELSCPFDLCVTPVESVRAVLENDFADYFDDLQFDDERKIWKNVKYNINYLHDDLNREDFIKRYEKRIKNFRQITSTRKNILFVQSLFNKNDDALKECIVQINKSLKRYCKYDYKYKVINLIPHKSPSATKKIKIAKNAYYFECVSPYDEKWTKCWTTETDNLPEVKPVIEKCIKTIYKG